MQKQAIVLVSIILFVSVLASGCITIEVSQKIRNNGDSTIQITYDFSKLVTTVISLNTEDRETGLEEFQANMTESCQKFYANTNLKNPECIVTEDYKFILKGELPLEDNPSLQISRSFPYTTYRIDAKEFYNVYSDIMNSTGMEQGPTEQTELSMGSAMGIKFDYVLEMPGKISRADLGEVWNEKIRISFFDIIQQDSAIVESRELNVLGIGLVLAVVIGIVLAALIYWKKTREDFDFEEPIEDYPKRTMPPGTRNQMPGTQNQMSGTRNQMPGTQRQPSRQQNYRKPPQQY